MMCKQQKIKEKIRIRSNIKEPLMGKELPAMNNYTWHILFRVLRTTVQPGQDRVSKYNQHEALEQGWIQEKEDS